MTPAHARAFVQGSGHGNVGYIGLPIALYYLGEAGLAKAGVIVGFSMILQNLLSIKLMRRYLRPPLGVVTLKPLLLPAVGLTLFSLAHLSINDYLPALILLCPPTATVAYVMTRQMLSGADFAVAAISASTLFSSFTYMLWLAVVSHLAILSNAPSGRDSNVRQ